MELRAVKKSFLGRPESSFVFLFFLICLRCEEEEEERYIREYAYVKVHSKVFIRVNVCEVMNCVDSLENDPSSR